MKRIVAFLMAALMLVGAVFTLTACSAYGGIEKNFVNAGYEVVNTEDEDGDNLLSITGSLEDGEVSCTVHILKKTGDSFLDGAVYAIIAEYSGDKEAMEALDDYLDGDLASVLSDLDENKLVNGNCLLIPFALSLNAKAEINEMIELFNK